MTAELGSLHRMIARTPRAWRRGRIRALERGLILAEGLPADTRLGDLVAIESDGGPRIGEVLELSVDGARLAADGPRDGLRIGLPVRHLGPDTVAPHESWLGRVVDPLLQPMDGRPLLPGDTDRLLDAAPVPASERRPLGPRLDTGLAVFDTLLPIARGQRIGLFAGSGVGKSTLLARLAVGVTADVVVLALIGERGREVSDFVQRVLGPAGMARTVVVAATSDRSAFLRRRCLRTAMAVAEHFRDRGRHVLLMADSLTRFAEAHREVALAMGEPGTLGGYPPSLVPQITGLCERAGPGDAGRSDITAVFSVLVAGSDMDEPVADIVRGVLDGHVVLDRAIAERGRFPAVDVVRSVSRSLPGVASEGENRLILDARGVIAAYERVELMLRAGLYTAGTDREVDRAIALWPDLDAFVGAEGREGSAESFRRLSGILGPGRTP